VGQAEERVNELESELAENKGTLEEAETRAAESKAKVAQVSQVKP